MDVESHSIMLAAGAGAFGDGRHPTTMGVLAALDAIDAGAFRPRAALDMGAGSGILAIAIARQFGCAVVASDIAASAVATIAENAQAAGLGAAIQPLHADGFAHPAIAARAPYDLIVMNILAEPLLALARAAEGHLAGGGVLIISGVLLWQEAQMCEAYLGLGLELASRLVVGDWVTLAFAKA